MSEIDDAYNRGLREGEIHALSEAVGRAHVRIDKHDMRLTAIEKVMYAGMGVVVVIQILPSLAEWFRQ